MGCQDGPEGDDGPLDTLGLLEQLREDCKALWSASSNAYFGVDGLLRQLANPNLHDIPRDPIATLDEAAITQRVMPRLMRRSPTILISVSHCAMGYLLFANMRLEPQRRSINKRQRAMRPVVSQPYRQQAQDP
jgi:hypothetical protein